MPLTAVMLMATAIAATGSATGSAGAPVHYWHSAPTLANETAVVAGAGFAGQHVTIVAGGASVPFTLLDATASTVKAVLPPACAGGAACQVCIGGALCVAVNAPDVWWAGPADPTRSAPASQPPPAGVHVAVAADDVLRVFGRALAWAAGGCINATTPAAGAGAVRLYVSGRAQPVQAAWATCYEAAFELAPLGLAPAVYSAWLSHAGGNSSALALTVLAPAATPAPAMVDVDHDFGGNVSAALAHAASLPAARVVLSAHNYSLAAPLTVPNGTALVGAGAAATTLLFALGPEAACAVGGHNDWTVSDMSIVVTAAPPRMPAVWMQPQGRNFTLQRTVVTLLQNNVSNAVRVEGHRFRVINNTLRQSGPCLWPNYGPGSDATSFQGSVTLYVHNASHGVLADNMGFWRCAFMDLDVSDRMIMERNVIACTETQAVPHGNSISGYDFRSHPSSKFWHIANNQMSRPPHNDPTHTNWRQRETMTTDGSSGFGTATLVRAAGSQVVLNWTAWINNPLPGTVLVVLAGPGVGQTRIIVRQ